MSGVSTAEAVDGRLADRFVGTGLLLRLMLRRERLTMLITFVVFVVLNAATAASIKNTYPTTADRAVAQAGLGANSAFRFLLGPLDHVGSAASMTVWRAGLFMVVSLAVCVVLQVVRQTRKEEELGRAELVRAGVVGSLSPVLAAALVAASFSLIVALGMSLMLFPLGAGAADVISVCAQYAATGWAAAGTALVAAQVAKTSHIANMAAAGVVLTGYLLRGAADAIGGWGWLRWLTPMGWAQLIDPFGDENLWWAMASVGLFVGGCLLAGVLADRRDLGGGLIAPRPGPASSSRLSSIDAVIVRLTMPLMVSWVVGVLAYAFVVGFMQPSVDELATNNSAFADAMRATGTDADLSTLFGMTMMGFFAVACGAWAVNVATRMHAEENGSRTELLLATPTARSRYFVAYVGVVVGGAVAILAGAVIALTVGNLIAGGDWARSGSDAVQSAAAQVPAVLVICAVALLLYSVSVRLVAVGWLAVVASLFLGPLAGMFNLPQWIEDLSPFTHTPLVPVEPMRWTPVVALLCVAVAVTVSAWWAFGRRDIG